MVNTNTVKGFKDFVGSEALKRTKLKEIIKNQFEIYGFEPVETPIIETEEFVSGENPNDEAVRDVFRLTDRGERKLALRYEFTFQLKRIAKNQKLPFKRYQIGDIFRDEPIREGRTRQFVQCDADVIGSGIKDEAELLLLGKETFEKIGIPVIIYVNNRKLINEILVEEKIDEKIRQQAIREIDKLDKLSKKEVADNLKKIGAENLVEIFTQDEKYFEKYKFYSEVKTLKKYCKDFGVDVKFRPYLARGFSYYNGTVFEVWSEKLKVALCGGGSYLVDKIQSSGISFGLEPIMLLSTVDGKNDSILVISCDKDKEAIDLARNLRNKNNKVNLVMEKTLSKALEYANSKGFEKVLIVGEEEIKKDKIKLKDMKTGKEELISQKDLIKLLKD